MRQEWREYSDFERYTADIPLPDGKVGQTQALGAFQVYAAYNGLEESQTGRYGDDRSKTAGGASAGRPAGYR